MTIECSQDFFSTVSTKAYACWDMEDAEVIEQYDLSPTPILKVATTQNTAAARLRDGHAAGSAGSNVEFNQWLWARQATLERARHS